MNTSKICYILPFFMIFAIPFSATGQNNNTNKKDNNKVINVNKLDVIYHDENEEYQDIVIDQKDDNQGSIPSPLAQPPAEDDEEQPAEDAFDSPSEPGKEFHAPPPSGGPAAAPTIKTSRGGGPAAGKGMGYLTS